MSPGPDLPSRMAARSPAGRSPALPAPQGRRTDRRIALLLGTATVAMVLAGRGLEASLTFDSAYYIQAARSLLQGLGLTVLGPDAAPVPLSHFPPLYSLVLAVGMGQGLSAQAVAGAVNLAVAASFPALLYLLLRRSGTARGACLFVTLLITFYPSMSTTLLTVSTDGLFLVLLLLLVRVLIAYLQAPTPARLAGMAALAAAASLLRFAGMFAGPAAAGVLLLQRPRAGRTVPSILLAFASTMPVFAYGRMVGAGEGDLASLSLSFFLPGLKDLKDLLYTFTSWVLPVSGDRIAVVTAAVALLLLIVLLLRRGRSAGPPGGTLFPSSEGRRLTLIGAVFFLFYLLLVAASRFLVHPAVTFNTRILLPAYLMTILALTPLLDTVFLRLLPCRRERRLALVLGAFLVLQNLHGGMEVLHESRTVGLHHSHAAWRGSSLLEAARNLPRDRPLLTNTPSLVYFYADRASVLLPSPADTPARARGSRSRLQELALLIAEEGGWLIGVQEHRREALFGLPYLIRTRAPDAIIPFEDGVLVRWDPSPAPAGAPNVRSGPSGQHPPGPRTLQ